MNKLSRRSIQSELAPFVKSETWRGLLVFAIDLATYVAAVAGVLFLPDLWMKIVCGVVAGIKICNLVTVAHDAAHGSLTRSAALNRAIAIVGFTPGLFNYRLWLYDHHQLHHPMTNGSHRDSWKPYSKEEFDSFSKWRQWREMFYRMPNLVGLGIYYIEVRWLAVKLFPRGFMPRRIHASAWRYFAGLMVYLVAFLALLAAAPLYSSTGTVMALTLGFVVPFYVWLTLISFTLYVHHTHPRVPWFDRPVERRTVAPQEALTVHLRLPRQLSTFMHNVYDHSVHHLQPMIPCYRLPEAQARLIELLGDRVVSSTFTFGWFIDTMRRCKLYDFEKHCWVDFDGRPTSDITIAVPAPVDESEESAIAAAS